MATSSLQSLLSPHQHYHHHQQLSFPSSDPSQPFFKLTTATTFKCFSNLISFSTTSTPSSSPPLTPATISTTTFNTLVNHLAAADFRKADEETRRLLIALAGDAAMKRGYVFFSEVQFISAAHLRAIDRLWRRHSGDRFGYSVQRRIWERKARRDFTDFFIRVGWMKKLDTEMEQYNYRSFPDEFVWELTDDTPEGHLPLTNALRGTQLLGRVLTHPAFDDWEDGGEGDSGEESDGEKKSGEEKRERPKLMRSLKPDYSF